MSHPQYTNQQHYHQTHQPPNQNYTNHTNHQNHPHQQLIRQQQQQHSHNDPNINNQQQQPVPHPHPHQTNHRPHQHHTSHTHSKKSHHRHHNHNHNRTLETRVFAVGYNYNYQFGLDNNDNHPCEIELEWCRGLNISYICSGLTHLIYLSFTGNYYFCGQIDTEKLGLVESHNKNINLNNKNNKNNTNIITKSCATPIDIFLPCNNSSADACIRVSRMADGVSSRHMIIITKDFRAYSMGSNQRGQLGLGHFKSTLNFAAIEFDNDFAFDCIDASGGEAHSAFVLIPRKISNSVLKRIIHYYYMIYRVRNKLLFALLMELISLYMGKDGNGGDERGRLYVCGCNNFGQLGIGNSEQQCQNKARCVSSGGLSNVSVAQVSCGENHTVCLDNRGRVYCFGDNYYGQSGAHLNHYENVYYPIKIEHFKKQYSARIVKISSGKYHCVALDKLGRVFCWGLGAYGQLGCSKLNKRIILPIYVCALQGEKVCDVRCGVYHTAAVTQDGKVFCWGSNNYGQCFQSTNQENIATPTLAKIEVIERNQGLVVYKIFCGYYSTIVLTRERS